MKIEGSHTVAVPRKGVWQALQDPAVLARTLPGCLQLEATGEDEYRMTVSAGVASIKGVYVGTVALRDQRPPESYVLKASGQGGPGTVDATARVTLSDLDDGTTRVDYDADAVVGGVIGGVGQRVLAGVAKKTAGEFFRAVEDELLGRRIVPEPVPATGAPVEAEPAAPGAPGAPGMVYRPALPPSAAPTGPADAKALLAAGALGALIALVGVLVGRRTARG